jgi:hypothetical protein
MNQLEGSSMKRKGGRSPEPHDQNMLELLTNAIVKRRLGELALGPPNRGITIASLFGWSAEIYEIEPPRSAPLADIFRCNWVDLYVRSGNQPLWSGMVNVGVPKNDYGPPVLMVQSEDFSRRGLATEIVVLSMRRLAS